MRKYYANRLNEVLKKEFSETEVDYVLKDLLLKDISFVAL
jgi:hypothetical protein